MRACETRNHTCPKAHIHRARLLCSVPNPQLPPVVPSPALEAPPRDDHARVLVVPGGESDGKDTYVVHRDVRRRMSRSKFMSVRLLAVEHILHGRLRTGGKFGKHVKPVSK
jgi:hypothetical protein